MTPDCHDLLLALLQRDPLARISFDDFFAHPFLDLEHVPSPVCLDKAVSESMFAAKSACGDQIDCINLITKSEQSVRYYKISGRPKVRYRLRRNKMLHAVVQLFKRKRFHY